MFNFIKKILKRDDKEILKERSNIPSEYIIPRSSHCISRADISRNALVVLGRLSRAGYSAYLVGGSVRDLLLRHAPKDFDVATDAVPEEIYGLFRNCRLIGRRFRLAHIHFGRDIVEVATFRAGEGKHSPEERHHHEGRLLKDNVYGTLEEDAWRRDFTVNALYYNIKDFSIVDFTGGLDDIKNKTLRIIGDPALRLREDPVRIIRAVRFAAKLNFTIDQKTEAAISQISNDIKLVSSARLFEEIIKLFHGGNAVKSFKLLEKYQLVNQLFEQTAAIQTDQNKQLVIKTLENTDARILEEKPITPAFLFAAFLWFPLLIQSKEFEERGMIPLHAFEHAMSSVLQQQRNLTALSKRLSQVVKEIWILQHRFKRRFGKRPFIVFRHPRFRAAYDFLLLRVAVNDEEPELAEWWTRFQEETEEEQIIMIKKFQQTQKPQAKKKIKQKNLNE